MAAQRLGTNMENQQNLAGEWILKNRELQGLSQTDLGDAIGRSRTTIWRYETGKDKPDDIALEIATVLRSDAAELLDAIKSDKLANGSINNEFTRGNVLNFERFEGFSELDEESRADVFEDVETSILRARTRQRRRENIGGSQAGRTE